MWGTEHEGITGVIFDSDGHRLVGTLYLARGQDPKPTAPGQARELRDRAKPGGRYVEVDGANHAFAWHRAMLCELIAGWLDEACGPQAGNDTG